MHSILPLPPSSSPSITKLSVKRKAQLEESLKFFAFLRDGEEEESWLTERQRIAKSMVTGRDLRSVISMQQKHAVSSVQAQRHNT